MKILSYTSAIITGVHILVFIALLSVDAYTFVILGQRNQILDIDQIIVFMLIVLSWGIITLLCFGIKDAFRGR